MHPQPYPSAWICPVLRLWTLILLEPACLHEFTQVWGMWCTSSPPPLLTDLHTFYAFFIRTQFKKIGCVPPPPLGAALPTLRSQLYCWSCAMKPDGRRANHIIVEISWPNRKETLILSVKLQPNVIYSQLGVISVRNRISSLEKLSIIPPIWKIRHFVDQQKINAWWIRPRMPLKLYIVYRYPDARM